MCVCVFVYQEVTPLQIVYPDTALRLQALLDFEEESGEKRVAGDEWLFEGPGGFLPLSVFFSFLSFPSQTETSIQAAILLHISLKKKLISHTYNDCNRKNNAKMTPSLWKLTKYGILILSELCLHEGHDDIILKS